MFRLCSIDVIVLIDRENILGYAQIIRSMQGKPLLYYDGYTFYNKSTNNFRTRWICSTHHRKKCRAAIYTMDSRIVKKNTVHNH
ncbi:hypothetical protein ABMA27_001365 [Loxostege sticticalis]|uniref:FLYWCH-type domain-containing protein n=1 Tax=Loxostege sticticalis TaxID=481309 RepID=A0ABR3HY85_LOXSC